MFRKLIFIMILGVTAQASELTHEFKNPSFSGNGYSTHVLSIEQLRYSRKNDVKEEQRRVEGQAKREAENTTINKFIKSAHTNNNSRLMTFQIAYPKCQALKDGGMTKIGISTGGKNKKRTRKNKKNKRKTIKYS